MIYILIRANVLRPGETTENKKHEKLKIKRFCIFTDPIKKTCFSHSHIHIVSTPKVKKKLENIY